MTTTAKQPVWFKLRAYRLDPYIFGKKRRIFPDMEDMFFELFDEWESRVRFATPDAARKAIQKLADAIGERTKHEEAQQENILFQDDGPEEEPTHTRYTGETRFESTGDQEGLYTEDLCTISRCTEGKTLIRTVEEVDGVNPRGEPCKISYTTTRDSAWTPTYAEVTYYEILRERITLISE